MPIMVSHLPLAKYSRMPGTVTIWLIQTFTVENRYKKPSHLQALSQRFLDQFDFFVKA